MSVRIANYPSHRAAKLLPAMSPDEYAGLKADIHKHGQREPIVLHKGRVLDGVHRLKACRELHRKPKSITLNDVEPVSYVVSRNLHRRHLTVSQRAMLAVALLPELEKAAKDRQRAGGRLKGRAKLREAGKATAHAAKVVGVSPRSVESAKVLEQTEPKLARRVQQGELSLGEAQARARIRIPRKRTGWLTHKRAVLKRYQGKAIAPAKLRRELRKGARSNAERIEAEQISIGDTVEGRKRIFEQATIRQITLAYFWKEHRAVVERLERVNKQTKTKNSSEAVLRLLDYWERGHKSSIKRKHNHKPSTNRKHN